MLAISSIYALETGLLFNGNINIGVCVCVNRSPEWAMWPNYEVVDLQASFRYCYSVDSAAYCYVRLLQFPCYSSPCLCYHTRSINHLGVSRLRPSISTYRTRSFAHQGVSRLHPSISASFSASPSSSGYHCVTLSPCSLLLFSSRETHVKVAWSCLSVASWRH